MYFINKLVGLLTDPMMLIALGFVVTVFLRRRARLIGLVFAALVWICAMPATSTYLMGVLERAYLPVPVARVETADAICLLGGGVGQLEESELLPCSNLMAAGDRVWMAARLYKAGKAPKIYCTGPGASKATAPLLVEMGVRAEDILSLDESRNTEEEAKGMEKALLAAGGRKVLLVTSGFHMRRAMRIFRKYASALEVVPAPTDFNGLFQRSRPALRDYTPSAEGLATFYYVFHEALGLVRYAF